MYDGVSNQVVIQQECVKLQQSTATLDENMLYVVVGDVHSQQACAALLLRVAAISDSYS